MDQEKIERALDACYDAIVAPETWPDALHALARSVDAVGCRFRGRNVPPTRELPMSTGVCEFAAEFVRDGWWRNDHRAQRAWPRFVSGTRVLLDHEITTSEERKRLPLLNELSRRHDLPWWTAVGLALEGQYWCLSFFRRSRQGPFEPPEDQRLAGFAPHLARMIRLSRKRGQPDALDRLAHATLLIDWKGAVTRTNAGAAALMGPDLGLCRGALTAADARSNRDLQNLIRQLRSLGPSRAAGPPGRVFVRRTGQAPLVIDALPVAGLTADVFGPSLAVLVVTDLELEAHPAPPEEALRAAFGLTAAEARLAAQLVGSGSLNAAADALGIAKETARNQLKAVFAKTGTHRQAELVALLARLSNAPGKFSSA